jgi:hypothetical protein
VLERFAGNAASHFGHRGDGVESNVRENHLMYRHPGGVRSTTGKIDVNKRSAATGESANPVDV